MQTSPHSQVGSDLPGETKPAANGDPASAELLSERVSVPETAVAPTVRFSLSQVSVEWDDTYESLLELAEDRNIDISGGCRYGDCGTCLTELLEGYVTYNHVTGVQPDSGYCLPCSCRPLTSITLKA